MILDQVDPENKQQQTNERNGKIMPTHIEENKRILGSIQDYFRTILNDKFKYPLRLMDDGYALQIRANQNDHIDGKNRKPGYLDVAVRPLWRRGPNGGFDKLTLRIWTEDRGSRINQELDSAQFADALIGKRPGLRSENLVNVATGDDARGLYGFYRDAWLGPKLNEAHELNEEQKREMLDDYLAIEDKLVELGIFER